MMKYAFLILITGTLFCCSADYEDPLDESTYGYDYFPLSNGDTRIYQVDSIQFDLDDRGIPTFDSSRYFIREVVVERFENDLGETVYRVEKYRTESLQEPWLIDGVLTMSRNARQAFYREDNLRFINLVFPIEEGVTWDGNAHIRSDMNVFVRGESIQMFANWVYRIASVGLAETIGVNTYQEVVTIQQADVENAIERRFSQEKYAKDIGLIYREREILDSYCKYTGDLGPCIGKTWFEKAGRGFRTVEMLIEHN